MLRRLWRRLLIIVAVLAATHGYLWWRFVAATDLPEPWRLVATVGLCVLAPSFPVAMLATRGRPRRQARPWLWIAYTWFGLWVYLLVAAAASHLACAVLAISPRTAAEVAVPLALATVGYGMAMVRRGPIVRRVSVPIAGLPAAANGYKIVQLTDVHIGWVLGGEFAARVVERVNALAPDLVVLTGDIVDGDLRELAADVEPLRGLAARDGVYAVTGNHEYYWNAEGWLAHLGSLGVRYLRNEHVAIGAGFALAGTDDVTAAGMAPGHGEDLARALAGRDPALPVVLLAHHPRSVAGAARAGVALQLSGHTHGGQLLPLGWLARLFEPQVAGLARVGATWLYVSEGTGFWGPPLRVGTRCEIAAIELRAA